MSDPERTVNEGSVALVTTARRPDPSAALAGRQLAEKIGARFVERGDRPITALQAGDLPVIVIEQDRVVCHLDGQTFFFHPGLIRMRRMGGPDGSREPLIEALDPHEGDLILDATLGRGGDAILIADAVGETGRVIGVEASPVVAELTRIGLASYHGPTPELERAMRRIEVVAMDHLEYLNACASGSFDMVYLDPMFDTPLSGSSSLDPLRPLARHDPLRREAVDAAIRVARRRVVVKSRRGAATLRDLGIQQTSGGRWSRVSYGIIPCV
ncbi:MAG TPA: class I SAM-dependent methyltransferase [Armatimonadota bacterium]|nr:class I SAM-dependent methyltransferase [Armatimonadota bacterium]